MPWRIFMPSSPARSGWRSSAGRPGFMERQLRRWAKQWDASKTADLPALDSLRDDLVAALPEQRASAIVHGDFRLDNTILHPDRGGHDRRGARLGDEHARRPAGRPRGDAGVLERSGRLRRSCDGRGSCRRSPPPTDSPPGPRSSSATPERTGIDPSDVGWYQAFAYFKLAVVCQGIAARAAGGAMVGSGFENDAERARGPARRGGPPPARRAPRGLSRRRSAASARDRL